MKKTIYEVQENLKDSDSFSRYFDDYEKALSYADQALCHLTESEKKKQEIGILTLCFTIPDDYTFTTAEQLINDLLNEEIDCPEVFAGVYTDAAQVDFKLIHRGW